MPTNQCGTYIAFPQVRIHLPPGAWYEPISPTLVPIYECQSSGGDSSSSDSSGGDPSGGGCTGLCGWVWQWIDGYGMAWVKVSGSCEPGCTCDPPDFDGSVPGEGVSTFCYPLG